MPVNRGVTGADDFISRRFETYSSYLNGVQSPNIISALAQSDVTLDGGSRTLGARPSNQYSLSQVIHYAQDRTVPAIPVEKITDLKQHLHDAGWVLPDTPINTYWGPGDPYYDIANHALTWERAHPESAPRPGVIESHGIFKWLGDLQLSRVFQGLVGLGKQMIADVGNVLDIQPLMQLNPDWSKNIANQDKMLAQLKAQKSAKEQAGGVYTYRDFMQDFNLKKLNLHLEKDITLASDDPRLDDPMDQRDWLRRTGAEDVLRRQFPLTTTAEALFSGLNVATLGAETSIAGRAIDPALKTLGEQWAKGGAEAAFRVIPDELTRTMNRSILNRVVTFTTGKMGWEEGAQMFRTVARPLWLVKSTAAGKLVTGGLTAATQVAVTARVRGAIESGYIFPGVNPLGFKQSQLSKTIDAAPVLGQGIAFGPAGEDRWLGNVVDLTGFVWAPESFLPVKLSDIRNGVMSMVGRNELAPLQQLFKMGRKQVIEGLGGEAATTTFMRYLKAQAHLDREAYAAANAAGKPGDGAYIREARFRESSRIKAGGPDALEAAIRGVTPEEVAKTSIRIFADGHGDPISWGRTHQILRDVEDRGILTITDALDESGNPILDDAGNVVQRPLVTVDDFRSASGRKSGTGIWGKANQDALDDIGTRIHQATSPKPATTAGGPAVVGEIERRLQQSNLSAAKRLGEQLTGDERLIFTRADKPVSTAQSVSQWYALNSRLRRLFPRLTEVTNKGEGILFKYGYRDFPQLLDLKAAGFTDSDIQQMRLASVTTGKGTSPIPDIQAQRIVEQKMAKLELPPGVTPGQQAFPVLGTAKVKAPISPTYSKADLYLDADQAARLRGSVDKQLVELATRFADNHPQFRDLLNGDTHIEMSRAARKRIRQYSATLPRAVTINDPAEMQKILDLGYEPAIGNKDMITLRDVGTGDIEQELGHARKAQGVMDFLGLGDAEVRSKTLATVMQNQVNAELGDLVARGVGIRGEIDGAALHRTLKDIAREAETGRAHIAVNGRPMWKPGQIFDLRSLTIRELQKYGDAKMTRQTALAIQSAIRRGYAYGSVADIRHPLQTLKGVSDMLAIRGIPGVEDLLRTLGTTGGDMRKLPPGLAPILRIPDKLVRARDFMQFGLNPLFTLQNAVETMQMRAFRGIPATMPFRAEKFVADFASQNPERFAEVMAAAFGDARGALYTQHAFDDMYQLVDRGFFGLNLRANEMADAIKLAERGEDLSTIGKKVEGVYRYGPGLRAPFMQSINYIFFPFSFNMKYTTNAIGWMNQNPARALAIHTGLAAWNKLNEDGKLKDWKDQHAPILHELNKLNSLGYGGLGFGTSPIGGRNKRVYDAWTASRTLLHEFAGKGIAPFIPMAVSEQDRKDMQAVLRRAVPAIKQAQDLWKASVSQAHALTQGGADDWQVSNFMEQKNALDDEINQDMLSIGLTGGRDSVGTKAMIAAYGGVQNAQAYMQWIDAQEKDMAQKYPQGQVFALRYVADAVRKSQELSTLADKQYKTPAENAILWFAAEKAREEMYAELVGRQHTTSRRRMTQIKLEVAAAAAKGLPVADIPGQLTQEQQQGLRGAAVRLAAAYPDFQYLYDRYFHNELGPITIQQTVAAGVGI